MKKLLFLLLISFVFITNPTLVQAQTSSITVSPALAKLDLSTDDPEVAFTYTNNTPLPMQISFKTEDFTDLTDGWQVKFLDPQDSANYRYSLSSWIHLESPDLVLKPNESSQFKVDIDRNRVTPGSHYAALVAQIQSITTQGKVALQANIVSLIFVRSGAGQEIEEAFIDSVDPVHSLLQYSDRFVVHFRNSGNVDLTPYGLVQVTDPFGRKVAQGIFNDGSFITLPESIRRYDVITNSTSNFLFPGEYTVHTVLHFGKSNKYIEKYTHYFSLGSISFTEIAIGFILLLGLALGGKKMLTKHHRRLKKSE